MPLALIRAGRFGWLPPLLKEIEADADPVGLRTLSLRHVGLDLMHQPGWEQDQAALDRIKIDFAPGS